MPSDGIRSATDPTTRRSKTRARLGLARFSSRSVVGTLRPTILKKLQIDSNSRRRRSGETFAQYKGVSVYRDGVLVLPKSEGARDWLGLDLRRVGRVGPRLSTTQLVGYVAITAAENAHLEDTSDRERLASTPEVIAFEETLRTIVEKMEQERDKDRRDSNKERKVFDLFKQLSAKDLVSNVSEVAKEGGPASETLPLVEEFSANLDKAREEIETRFVYYSRLATVGTISHMLIHEIRNRTTVLGHVLDWIARRPVGAPDDKAITAKLELGMAAVAALDKLAETFAPLANRQFKRRMRSACIEESVLRCSLMLSGELKAGNIAVSVPTGTVTEVAVDPGELDAVVLNLMGNAVYWLSHQGDRDARSRFAFAGSRVVNGHPSRSKTRVRASRTRTRKRSSGRASQTSPEASAWDSRWRQSWSPNMMASWRSTARVSSAGPPFSLICR